MPVDRELVKAAIDLAERRYAGDPDGDGWAGAVAMYTGDGRILTSIFVILTACGICQERLAHWGGDVEVGVPRPEDPSRWLSTPLRKLQPHFWAKAQQHSW